ncbi:MAG: hypothetical protein PHT79_00020, partial [Syntrophomonadaceae bacterium]|nr:hypothetical protein [Syntrophomonadaceae bacterium]
MIYADFFDADCRRFSFTILSCGHNSTRVRYRSHGFYMITADFSYKLLKTKEKISVNQKSASIK